jgi:DNA adenine methylase
MDKSINSPFRYAGGKFYARNLILEHIPPHSAYIEPFAGGGSIFFAKNKVSKNWLNDVDPDLVNTYVTIQSKPDELIKALSQEVATKERHAWYKNEFIPVNDFEKAVRWYYLNRTSYSGIMNPKNCYWGYGDKYSMRPENWGRNILRTSQKLQNVQISCLDFETVFEKAEDGAFLFIDPPYFNADQDKFYSFSFTYDDHIRLSKALREHQYRIKFLLTYDNSPEIRMMYSWATEIHDKEWNYTINRTDDQKLTQALKNGIETTQKAQKKPRYKGREIFILNYSTQQNQLFTTYDSEEQLF